MQTSSGKSLQQQSSQGHLKPLTAYGVSKQGENKSPPKYYQQAPNSSTNKGLQLHTTANLKFQAGFAPMNNNYMMQSGATRHLAKNGGSFMTSEEASESHGSSMQASIGSALR